GAGPRTATFLNPGAGMSQSVSATPSHRANRPFFWWRNSGDGRRARPRWAIMRRSALAMTFPSEIDVPDDDRTLAAGGGGPHAVRGEGHVQHLADAPVQCGTLAPGGGLVEAHRAVIVAGGQQTAVGREGDGLEVLAAEPLLPELRAAG